MEGEQRPSKRMKTTKILNEDEVSHFDVPYPHTIIENLVDESLLTAVRDELMRELHFTQKETDIYKVNQTGDLKSLEFLSEEDKKKLSNTMKLRDQIYSQEFRAFIKKISNCPIDLNDKTDMSVNLYSKGCHLLAHDDMIGSRKISFILYLAADWKPEYGGSLRLYPTESDGKPSIMWSKTITPLWNRMALFEVMPGVSIHDVEEVSVNKDRLAISGWFHADQVDRTGASLDSLSSTEGDVPKLDFVSCVPHPSDVELTSEDKNYLRGFIDERYLSPIVIEKLKEKFCDESNFQLAEFLSVGALKKISIVEKDCEWMVASPPHKHRYQFLQNDVKSSETHSDGWQWLLGCLASEPFQKWLAHLTSLELTSRNLLARRFRPGLDYTLAVSCPSYLELTLDLTPSEKWEDNGGYQVYMQSEDDTDPAVYQEGDGALLSTMPQNNLLTLVMRDEDVLRFEKYVSTNAEGSRWDVFGRWVFVPIE
ncbi:prolyl 3,4-dihydroxylase [Acrasis kona]|uniref:Prolyl 3,4-dihydroxylase n=1 Tax=Acrasis kona TaxID=1008807 RepID=A0AAW2ZME2_9EUKA